LTSEILYRKLQQHLDRMPIPFPRTESGVEIRILQLLFTPEDAELALEVSAIPEPATVIHKRLRGKIAPDELARRLDDMAARGLIMRLPAQNGPLYGKMVFVVGIFERQLKRLTPELERAARQYMEEAYAQVFPPGKTKQLRTVPVNRSIPIVREVATHEDIRGYVETTEGPFARMDCICRHGKELLGEECKQTTMRENCLTMGHAATAMVDAGVARYISREEMLALLEAAEKEGLVLQPQNTKSPLFVCCCCGCCCGVLTSAKRFPRPADYFNSNFTVEADPAKCEACGACESRCQMDAISRDGDEKTRVDESRCIGCALCLTTCPSGALQLKPKAVPRVPPDDTMALYGKILQERFGPLQMANLGVRRFLGWKI
jgi:Na+-translocating ferredoxin:NAD+ oxidoreductase subunit B